MKLKVLMASLIVLGINSPLFAEEFYDLDAGYQQDVMRNQINKMDIILEKNQPGGFDQPCGWTCRINVSGWINTDAYIASRSPKFRFFNYNPNPSPGSFRVFDSQVGKASDLLLNNANLFIDTRVNNWVTARMSLVYSSLTGVPGSTGSYNISKSLFVYHPINQTNLDTAYATIGNFQASPIYFRVGKEYVPFGQYNPYAFVQSENPTQLFTEINAPVAQLGFIFSNGFYGSAYTFAGNPKLNDAGSTRRVQNGGVDLGFGWKAWNSTINVDAGWIANIADSNFLSSYYLNQLIEGTNVPGLPNQKSPAWDVNADLTFGPFDANGHYIATTQNLLAPFGLAIPLLPVNPGIYALGKSRLWGLELGLTFPVKFHQSRIAIGYQSTIHLPGLLPKQR